MIGTEFIVCPPDILTPLSPMVVSSPSGSSFTNSFSCASSSTSHILLSEAARPKLQATKLQDKIVLDHITYAYPNTEKNIFTDAHMEVKKGQSVGIQNLRIMVECSGNAQPLPLSAGYSDTPVTYGSIQSFRKLFHELFQLTGQSKSGKMSGLLEWMAQNNPYDIFCRRHHAPAT